MGLNFYRRKMIVNSENNLSDVKRSIFREIRAIHYKARADKPENLEDYNVNSETAKRYRELLKTWWSLPYGLDFVPYNINKGKTFGALNKYI